MNTNSIEEAADEYAKDCNGGSSGSGIIQQSFKAGAQWQQSQPVSAVDRVLQNSGLTREEANKMIGKLSQSQEQQPVLDKDIELKDFLVIMNEGQFSIWTKGQYESYVSKALEVGACPAVKLVTHFNNQDDLLAALNKQSDGWISVKDRLPENSVPVLAISNEGGTIFHHVAEIWGQVEWSNNTEILYFITHWMPLPKQPKNKINEQRNTTVDKC